MVIIQVNASILIFKILINITTQTKALLKSSIILKEKEDLREKKIKKKVCFKLFNFPFSVSLTINGEVK